MRGARICCQGLCCVFRAMDVGCSVLLFSCFITAGALGSCGLLPSCSIIALA